MSVAHHVSLVRHLKSEKEDLNYIAEQSFGMYNVHIHHIVFELCLVEKERKKML